MNRIEIIQTTNAGVQRNQDKVPIKKEGGSFPNTHSHTQTALREGH